MDKTEGKDFEVRLRDLEAKYVEIAEKIDETDVDDLDQRVDDLEAKHEEIVENMDDFESQASDVAIQIDSFDEHVCHLEGWLASLQSDHNDRLGWISGHESQLSDHESQLSELESQLSELESQLSDMTVRSVSLRCRAPILRMTCRSLGQKPLDRGVKYRREVREYEVVVEDADVLAMAVA
jgi:chromosome segregation ATPase